jgi:hypothetical protein
MTRHGWASRSALAALALCLTCHASLTHPARECERYRECKNYAPVKGSE